MLQRAVFVVGALVLSCTGTVIASEQRAARSLYFEEMSMSMSFSMPSSGSFKGGSKSVKGSKSAKSKGIKGCPPPKEPKATLHPIYGKGKGKASKHAITCEPTFAPGPSGKSSCCRHSHATT